MKIPFIRRNHKARKVSLHVITMNRNDILKTQLKECRAYFDTIRVCVGNRDIETKNICSSFGVEYYYREWDDQFQEQDNVLLDRAKQGEWIMIMDDDEIPSPPLLTNLRVLINRAVNSNKNMIFLPSILNLNGVLEEELDTFIKKVKEDYNVFGKYWLFEYDKSVRSYGTPHRLVETEKGWNVLRQPYPYIHFKTSEGFIINDCLHSFISPQDQKYSRKMADDLKLGISGFNWKYSVEIIPTLEKGNANPEFIKFIWKYKDLVDHPISRWFWVYYFLLNQSELPEYFNFETDPSYIKFKEMIGERR